MVPPIPTTTSLSTISTETTAHPPTTRDPTGPPFTGNLGNPVSLSDLSIADITVDNLTDH